MKMKIYSFWRIDCYLIRYGKGTMIGLHKDEIKGYKHYRLNILLKGEDDKLFVHGKPIFRCCRVILFRPDMQLHGVETTNKSALLLSFGWKVKE
jgi:hypothetical protein